MRGGERGFGILETLMALFLVGIILGIVGRGYQALSRLNLATYQMSQRMELTSFLQRLSNEVANAITLEPTIDGFGFERIDPTLNLTYETPVTSRLPWKLPHAGIGTAPLDLLASVHRVKTEYRFVAAEHLVQRTAYAQTAAVAVDIGLFEAGLDSSGRILSVKVQPKEMTAPVQTRIFLPVRTAAP